MTSPVCLLGCAPGDCIQKLSSLELVEGYQSYYQITLTPELIEQYFREVFTRWRCPICGLEWFTPQILGGDNFYQFLGKNPWYYHQETWDKVLALKILRDLESKKILEVGSGGGQFLSLAEKIGIKAVGVELNKQAIEQSKENGLEVYNVYDAEWRKCGADTLIMLQFLEHVDDPVQVFSNYSSLASLRSLIIAVPTTESTLAFSSDPLVWPPHHATLWSHAALVKLAETKGFKVTGQHYQPNSWPEFLNRISNEKERRLRGFPKWPCGIVGRLAWIVARYAGLPWAKNAHSILVTMEKE